MYKHSQPLRYASEVQSAVLRAGLPDLDMAHGASLVAAPETHVMLDTNVATLRWRNILGITAIALRFDGTATYRTAVFGHSDSTVIDSIQNVGEQQIAQVGAQSDPRMTSLMTSPLVLKGHHSMASEGPYCTVGGSVIHTGEDTSEITASHFLSKSFAEHMAKTGNSRAAKIGNGVASLMRARKGKATQEQSPSPQRQHILRNYSAIAAVAMKRGGPIVVEQSFQAQI